ncbi:PIG-L family deacetylase [Nocardia yunnanensis]|uniref:PIG-L family deacetylase n=1 Tax=Nocardia yunnanensis TaxID=2382165 RepID=A0A386ZLT5_9NOCA|nr:PIG-L family deacetylase [Nocardia yunnanensis]AYF78398.1 PIG-L family deacetylase [Nocardia yunnanensis]
MDVSRMLDTAGRVVVVSPHFDDAVLSVGGLIAGCAGRGQPVEVLTVFSAAGAASGGGRMRAFSDYETRVREDDRALALLGARPERLGLSERLFRDPPPRGPLPLFRTSPDLARGEYPATVQRAIRDVLATPDTIVLAPLGIGNHVDHVIVAVGALLAMPERASRLLFYEDFNALSERNRRRHPVSRLRPFPIRGAPAWASPRAGFELEATSALARGPDPVALAGHSARDGQWHMTASPVDAAAESAKLDAVSEYRTQTAALGGESALHSLLRRAHTVRGGELIWQFRPEGQQ